MDVYIIYAIVGIVIYGVGLAVILAGTLALSKRVTGSAIGGIILGALFVLGSMSTIFSEYHENDFIVISSPLTHEVRSIPAKTFIITKPYEIRTLVREMKAYDVRCHGFKGFAPMEVSAVVTFRRTPAMVEKFWWTLYAPALNDGDTLEKKVITDASCHVFGDGFTEYEKLAPYTLEGWYLNAIDSALSRQLSRTTGIGSYDAAKHIIGQTDVLVTGIKRL